MFSVEMTKTRETLNWSLTHRHALFMGAVCLRRKMPLTPQEITFPRLRLTSLKKGGVGCTTHPVPLLICQELLLDRTYSERPCPGDCAAVARWSRIRMSAPCPWTALSDAAGYLHLREASDGDIRDHVGRRLVPPLSTSSLLVYIRAPRQCAVYMTGTPRTQDIYASIARATPLRNPAPPLPFVSLPSASDDSNLLVTTLVSMLAPGDSSVCPIASIMHEASCPPAGVVSAGRLPRGSAQSVHGLSQAGLLGRDGASEGVCRSSPCSLETSSPFS
ncbi:hypothetical protein OH77DRAFT_555952 [Trametes cingulata]|nr:hypothetical protein OH77DRAFT_555952 [Trametes cingulata]